MNEPVLERPALGIARRLQAVKFSKIVEITERANELKAAGRPVIVLGAGEPDFDTPEFIKTAATEALAHGATKYTPTTGTPELKDAIRAKLSLENGLTYARTELIVCTGAKHVIYNAMAATLDPGDEVLLVAPYWTSYADIVRICGGEPRVVETTDRNAFRLTPQALASAITPRTRWLFLNAPSNPAGVMYDCDALKALGDVLLAHPNVWVLCDDIYEHLVYDGRAFTTLPAAEPRLRDRTLIVNGVSKAYAMTGWRIGYGAGPPELISALATVQGQITSCASAVGQAAAVAALTGPQGVVAERTASFQARRDLVVARIRAVPGLTCNEPEGAFYLYVDCSAWIGRQTPRGERLNSDDDVCMWLLDEHDVAVVPGSAFGLSPFFRISYAASTGDLEEACARMHAAASELV